MRLQIVLAMSALALMACDPCAGTPSCHSTPELSYGGQFIERLSGSPVSGVEVQFVRQAGIELVSDTTRATSDADGFFQLRSAALFPGSVDGDLHVVPPAPHAPYTVRGITLTTTETRGNGGVLGRLLVNPYVQLVIEVLDKNTLTRIPNASVRLRQIGAPVVKPDSIDFVTSENGSFWWEPEIVQFAEIEAEFDVNAPGYPKTFRLRRRIRMQYEDEGPKLIGLQLGDPGLHYFGDAVRRGNGERRAGVVVNFARKSGTMIQPDTFTVAANDRGVFTLKVKPLDTGVVIGDLTITPPAPFPVEVIRDLRLIASIEDTVRNAGFYGFGPSVYFRARLRYRATGLPVEKNIQTRVQRVGGLEIVYAPGSNPSADAGLRNTESDGSVPFTVATADTGEMIFDIEVRLKPPHNTETVRGVRAPARYSDSPAQIDNARVGIWFPWRGELRDDATNQPVRGAQITFTRTSGAAIQPAVYTTTSQSDGTFPLQPVPLESGNAVGSLQITTSGAFRDTTMQQIQLVSSQDDTLRSLPVIRLKRP